MLEACNGILARRRKAADKVRGAEIGQLAGGYWAFQILVPEYQA